jgi:hypothetical protein
MENAVSAKRVLAVVLYAALTVTAWILGLADLRPRAELLPSDGSGRLPLETIERHLGRIAVRPHAVGTTEHDRVRDYILSELTGAGLSPAVQRTTAVWDVGALYRLADLENIVAEVPGSDPGGKAVLIASHYDSAPLAPGAADAGASVAIMIEMARALRQGPRLANPVIFLFSDGEEWGLLGARAFIDENPAARRVGAVVNLEARGSGGRPFVFETSGGVSGLLSVLSASRAPVLAASYADEGYRMTGNDTDFTAFRKAGMPGFNLAFFDDWVTYHTTLDTPDRLSRETLKLQAESAYRLALKLAETPLDSLSTEDKAVYTSLPTGRLLSYSEGWAFPAGLLVLFAATALWVYGFRRERYVRTSGTLRALGAVLLAPALVTAVLYGLHLLLAREIDQRLIRWPQFDLFLTGSLLAAAALTYLTLQVAPGVRRQEFHLASCLLFGVLACVAAFAAPGASYLFLIAAAFTCLLFAWGLWWSARHAPVSVTDALVSGLIVFPLVFLWSQPVALFTSALGMRGQFIIIPLFALLAALILPVALDYLSRLRWLLPVTLLACAGGCYLLAFKSARFDSRNPLQDHVVLAADLNTQKQFWGTLDAATDEWSDQLFKNPELQDLGTFFGGIELPVLTSPVGGSLPEGPWAEQRGSEGNELGLWIKSAPGAVAIRFDVFTDLPLKTVIVNEKVLRPRQRSNAANNAQLSFVYLNPPAAGVPLSIEMEGRGALNVSLVDIHYWGEAAPPGLQVPRPAHIIAGPDKLTDCTLVRRSFSFNYEQ